MKMLDTMLDKKLQDAAEKGQAFINSKKGVVKTLCEAVVRRRAANRLSGRDTTSLNENWMAKQQKSKSSKRRKTEKANRRRGRK